MIAVIFEGYQVTIGRGQENLVNPLPCHVFDGIATSCWQLSDEDVAEIIRTRRVWLQVLKGASPHQPVKLLAFRPELDGDQPATVCNHVWAAVYYPPSSQPLGEHGKICTQCGVTRP
jgi:hypothetical protein